MAQKGVCELCGFADDSYRIEENGTVMRVCKFCHDGHLERMGLSPDEDKPLENAALALDIDETDELDTEGLSGEELLRIEMEIAARKQESSRVPTLAPEVLGTLLSPSEDDKRIINNVRQRELRRKKRAAEKGEDETGEDYKASEELLRSGEELQKVMDELENVDPQSEIVPDDEKAAPLIAKIVAPKTDNAVKQEQASPETAAAGTGETAESVDDATPADKSEDTEKAETREKAGEPERSEEEQIYGQPEEKAEDPPAEPANTEEQTENTAAYTNNAEGKTPDAEETDMNRSKTPENKDARKNKEDLVRERIHAEANQKIDDERIKITSPEVALSKDDRPKTNLDVAVSEYTGGVRFLDSFKYVMHRISYTVFLALIVLAVSTVLFIRDGWQHGLIVLGGGAGAVLLGFMLMWYLSHCYQLDRRAYLLRIRQQEILFESMNSDCYRELRTKFTVIKAFGWLLNKLTLIIPLITVVGGNIAAVIVAFLNVYWLFPVVSAAATVGSVIMYYIIKFSADWIAYALDRERNQQVQQQTLLDILSELKKDK